MTKPVDTKTQTETPNALVTREQIGPMQLLQIAVAQGADIDKLEKLMALQERWEANEARKAYVSAMAAFKANPPDIFKTKQVAFNDVSYKHALLSDATEQIGRALSAHGLSATWKTEQSEGGMTRVTCIITHSQGHSESVSLQAGLDQSGKKNNIQALGSTVSYLERYTLFAATGLAAKDQDDDGAKHEDPQEQEQATITDDQASELHAMLIDAGVKTAIANDRLAALAKLYGCVAITDLPAEHFEAAKARLADKIKKSKEKAHA